MPFDSVRVVLVDGVIRRDAPTFRDGQGIFGGGFIMRNADVWHVERGGRRRLVAHVAKRK